MCTSIPDIENFYSEDALYLIAEFLVIHRWLVQISRINLSTAYYLLQSRFGRRKKEDFSYAWKISWTPCLFGSMMYSSNSSTVVWKNSYARVFYIVSAGNPNFWKISRLRTYCAILTSSVCEVCYSQGDELTYVVSPKPTVNCFFFVIVLLFS